MNASSKGRLAARGFRRAFRLACQRGLTLVELLITMVIAAILLTFAVPALQSFVTTNQLATSANELVASLNLARSEAVRSASPVGLCVGVPTANSWVVAPLLAGTFQCDPANVLRRGALSSTALQLNVSAPNGGMASFDALGRLQTTPGTSTASFMVCQNGQGATAAGQSLSRAVVVASSGRVNVAPTDNKGLPVVPTPDGSQTQELSGCTG